MAYSSDTTESLTFGAGPALIGPTAASFVGFHGKTPCIQASHIADVTAGGGDGTTLTACTVAINAINTVLENKGWVATS